MGKCCKYVLLLSIALLAWMSYNVYNSLYRIPPIPNLPLDRYWGPGDAPKVLDKSIKSFVIKFDPKMVEDVKYRLENDNFYTEPLEGVGFQYGFNNNYLKEVVNFWKTSYNFNEREAFLNQYPQFKTNIQGLDIHFIHVKPKVPQNIRVLPLLLLHGWPGSIKEFYDVIPLLTKPRKGFDFVFELVIPSLPGFGFSQASSKTGMCPAQMAVIMRNLMERLGYEKYIIQGGDWGSLITSHMATLYPEKILGYHTNAAGTLSSLSFVKLFLGSLYPSLVVDKNHEHKMYPLINSFYFILAEGGYAHIQGTKPDTIGAALKCSPVALAAYIIEKFSAWTNPKWIDLPDGGITKNFKLTDLLDNIAIYWFSSSITTSVRIYKESLSKAEFDLQLDLIPIKVPTAIANFEYELMFSSDWQLKDKYQNVVQKSEFSTGGHFAAFEEPEKFANDLWTAVPKFDAFYKQQEIKAEL